MNLEWFRWSSLIILHWQMSWSSFNHWHSPPMCYFGFPFTVLLGSCSSISVTIFQYFNLVSCNFELQEVQVDDLTGRLPIITAIIQSPTIHPLINLFTCLFLTYHQHTPTAKRPSFFNYMQHVDLTASSYCYIRKAFWVQFESCHSKPQSHDVDGLPVNPDTSIYFCYVLKKMDSRIPDTS